MLYLTVGIAILVLALSAKRKRDTRLVSDILSEMRELARNRCPLASEGPGVTEEGFVAQNEMQSGCRSATQVLGGKLIPDERDG